MRIVRWCASIIAVALFAAFFWLDSSPSKVSVSDGVSADTVRPVREVSRERELEETVDDSRPGQASSELARAIVEAVNDQSCADAERLGMRFADGADIDQGSCARALALIFGPRVPALPGFAGFEIRDAGDGSPRSRLFEEADDPAWSRAMESQILNESSNIVSFPLITLHAVCRSSICGVLFAYTDAAYFGGSHNYYAQQLADELGFSGYHAGSTRGHDGIGFTYIYLGSWDTQRPEYPD